MLGKTRGGTKKKPEGKLEKKKNILELIGFYISYLKLPFPPRFLNNVELDRKMFIKGLFFFLKREKKFLHDRKSKRNILAKSQNWTKKCRKYTLPIYNLHKLMLLRRKSFVTNSYHQFTFVGLQVLLLPPPFSPFSPKLFCIYILNCVISSSKVFSVLEWGRRECDGLASKMEFRNMGKLMLTIKLWTMYNLMMRTGKNKVYVLFQFIQIYTFF